MRFSCSYRKEVFKSYEWISLQPLTILALLTLTIKHLILPNSYTDHSTSSTAILQTSHLLTSQPSLWLLITGVYSYMIKTRMSGHLSNIFPSESAQSRNRKWRWSLVVRSVIGFNLISEQAVHISRPWLFSLEAYECSGLPVLAEGKTSHTRRRILYFYGSCATLCYIPENWRTQPLLFRSKLSEVGKQSSLECLN